MRTSLVYVGLRNLST